MNAHYTSPSDAYAIDDMGFRWVRIDFVWSKIQPRQPTATDDGIDWGAVDSYRRELRLLENRKIKVLGVLGGPPKWALRIEDIVNGVPVLGARPNGSSQYLQFVEFVVTKVARNVMHFNLWNEPNLDCMWHGINDAGGIEGFANEILIPGSQVVRKFGAKVVGPDFSITDHYNTVRVFYETLRDYGQYLDVIDFHHYGWDNNGDSSQNNGIKLVSALFNKSYSLSPEKSLSIISAIDEAPATRGKPIWVTELGIFESGPNNPVGEDGQAEEYRKLISEAKKAEYNRIEKYFLYELNDSFEASQEPIPTNHYGNMGLLFNTGTSEVSHFKPKKAYYAIQSALLDLPSEGEVKSTRDGWSCSFGGIPYQGKCVLGALDGASFNQEYPASEPSLLDQISTIPWRLGQSSWFFPKIGNQECSFLSPVSAQSYQLGLGTTSTSSQCRASFKYENPSFRFLSLESSETQNLRLDFRRERKAEIKAPVLNGGGAKPIESELVDATEEPVSNQLEPTEPASAFRWRSFFDVLHWYSPLDPPSEELQKLNHPPCLAGGQWEEASRNCVLYDHVLGTFQDNDIQTADAQMNLIIADLKQRLLSVQEYAFLPTPFHPDVMKGIWITKKVKLGCNSPTPTDLYHALDIFEQCKLVDLKPVLSSTIIPGIRYRVTQIKAQNTLILRVWYHAEDSARHQNFSSITPTFFTNFTAVASGDNHTCAIAVSGQVYCWGNNYSGQLGTGNYSPSPLPVRVVGIENAAAIAVGGSHSCAILLGGQVKCWGYNWAGQLGDGTTENRSTPVVVEGLTGVTALAAGDTYTCALLNDTSVKCWGRNMYGQLGDGTTENRSTPVTVEGLTGVMALAAGSFHSCAIHSGGQVKCWGYNWGGQLGDGTYTNQYTPVAVEGLTGVTSIAGGGTHTCAVLSGGQVICWGANYSSQLGIGSSGGYSMVPVLVLGIANAASVELSYSSSCATLQDGKVKCWGSGEGGQMGNGLDQNQPTPVFVSGITNARTTSSGSIHSCALLQDGNIKCWGQNNSGALGNGSNTRSNLPVEVINQGFSTAPWSITTMSDHDLCRDGPDEVQSAAEALLRHTHGEDLLRSKVQDCKSTKTGPLDHFLWRIDLSGSIVKRY